MAYVGRPGWVWVIPGGWLLTCVTQRVSHHGAGVRFKGVEHVAPLAVGPGDLMPLECGQLVGHVSLGQAETVCDFLGAARPVVKNCGDAEPSLSTERGGYLGFHGCLF